MSLEKLHQQTLNLTGPGQEVDDRALSTLLRDLTTIRMCFEGSADELIQLNNDINRIVDTLNPGLRKSLADRNKARCV